LFNFESVVLSKSKEVKRERRMRVLFSLKSVEKNRKWKLKYFSLKAQLKNTKEKLRVITSGSSLLIIDTFLLD